MARYAVKEEINGRRRWVKRTDLLFFVGSTFVTVIWTFLAAANPPTLPARNLVVEDLSGQRVHPFAATNAKAILFVFVSVDCPICGRYVPELNRLQAEFRDKN